MYQAQYLHYHPGSPDTKILTEALHAKGPGADLYTGKLVQAIHESNKTAAIVSNVSRETMDLNRPRTCSNQPAVDEYRQVISQMFEDRGMLDEYGRLQAPFLQISIHGMQDEWKRDVEIGTGYGHYCSPVVKQWLINFFNGTGLNFGMDDLFPGYTFRSVLREGDMYGQTSFMGFGPYFQTVQIEISQHLRTHYFQWLVETFTGLIQEFEETFPDAQSVKCLKKQSI